MAITMIIASLLGLMFFALSYRIILLRRKLRVGIGAGEHPDLERAIRAQANCAEYVPLSLILIGLLEFQGANSLLVVLLGALLIVGRILHGWFGINQSAGPSGGRIAGMLMTFAVILIASCAGLLISASVL